MEYFEDPDWLESPITFPGADQWVILLKHTAALGLVSDINGMEVGYVDVMNYWVPLVSSTYALRCMQMIGNTNASVNYGNGFSGYVPKLIKAASAYSVPICPLSVCVGTRRLIVNWDIGTSTIEFTQASALVTVPKPKRILPTYVRSICFLPAAHTIIPRSFSYPNRGRWMEHIEPFFPDKRALVTYLWIVGNCILDPVTKPRCLLLCGPGGSGKSTALRGARASLTGCTGLLADNCLQEKSSQVASEVAGIVVSSRLAVCFELDFDKKPVNMALLKNVTGGDYIKVGDFMCKALCSFMIATNGLPDHSTQKEFQSDAIMRRLVCLEMKVTTSKLDTVADPNDTESRLNLLCNAIVVRLHFQHLPIRPMDVLLTLCGSKYHYACKFVKESSTGIIDQAEGRSVAVFLAGLLDLPVDEVLNKARFISPTCIEKTPVGYVIKGLHMYRELAGL